MRVTEEARRKENSNNSDSLFVEEAVFEAFDAGVALVCGPHVPSAVHLLRDVVEHVAVLLRAFQRELHRALAPDLQQRAGLLLRPGRLPAQVSLQEAAAHQLLDWAQKPGVHTVHVCAREGLKPPSTYTCREPSLQTSAAPPRRGTRPPQRTQRCLPEPERGGCST